MSNRSLWIRIIRNGMQFMNQVAKGSERLFLALFSLFVFSFLMRRCGWEPKVIPVIDAVHLGILGLVLWGSTIYLLMILAEWKKLWNSIPKLILLAVVLLAITFCFSRKMTTDTYSTVIGAFLCIMAYKKSYRKILCVLLCLIVGLLLFCWLGTFIGITADIAKSARVFGGHSFGVIYPNTWAFLSLAALMLLWYCYLKNKPLLTFSVFLSAAIFMWFVVSSRTSAMLAAAFPFIAVVAELIGKQRNGDLHRVLKILLIFLPVLAFGLTLILCWKMEWVRDTFYKTKFISMAMRFVEGGYALRNNPVSLFGHPLNDFDPTVVDESFKITRIMDNAYVSNLILRGVVWAGVCFSWLSLAHWKCLKKRDYRLLVISFFFLILAMMERPALDVWFNFVLLYPLAAGSFNQEETSA